MKTILLTEMDENCLKKNVNRGLIQDAVHCGLSLAIKGRHGLKDRDIVIALPCKSWPQSVSD
jgi:hypothetical protein